MSKDLMREQFEEFWLKSEYSQGLGEASLVRVWMDDPQSDYAINRTQYLWSLWKASREAVVVELPAPEYFGDHWSGGWAITRENVVDALEEQGLRVKP